MQLGTHRQNLTHKAAQIQWRATEEIPANLHARQVLGVFLTELDNFQADSLQIREPIGALDLSFLKIQAAYEEYLFEPSLAWFL